MHLYIRADADGKIGAGHTMRCIALAQAWKDQGGEVTFISHCESEALKERIQSEGFRFIALDNVCPDSSDLKNTLSILKNENADQKTWLVLDGYHFNPEYQKAIRDEGIRLLVIDDINHLPHYHADMLLNQNIHALNLKYHCDKDTTLLMGTRYVLLRREFKKWQCWQREIPTVARKVLVTLGGGDPDNVTLKVIQALKQLNLSGLEAKIVVGPANTNLQILERETSDHPNLQIITNATNMPELMIWADVAVSAGGSTCWEMAFLGLPNMIIYFAENQRPIAEELHETGAALSLGWGQALNIDAIAENLERLLLSQECRKRYSIKSHEIVDGSGAQRVCRERI